MGGRAHDDHVLSRGDLVGAEHLAAGHNGSNGQGRECLDHPAKQGPLILVGGAETDKDQRMFVEIGPWGVPRLGPVGVIQDRSHVGDVGGHRA
jgi:hypothetical protein